MLEGVTSSFVRRNISLIEFLDYYETYTNSITQLLELSTNRLRTLEEINFAVGKPVITYVFESDISKIKEGYEAEATTLSYPDKIFKGKIDRIFNVLDPETRTMKVRVRLDNPDFSLKPEMFANIRLEYPDDKQLLAVPAQSFVFDQSKNYVMVYRKRCDVELREVQLYQTVGETTYLKSGLKAGESMISKYTLLVFNASKAK